MIAYNRRLKIKKDFDEADLKSSGLYSFLNFASLSSYFENDYDEIIFYCDGMLMSNLVSLISSRKVKRVSFDFTSIANDVFQYANENELRVGIVGASKDEIEKFHNKICIKYPKIKVVFLRDGYFSEEETEDIINSFNTHKIDFFIAGLGAGKQENFLLSCKIYAYSGVGYTCGGFIRQESSSFSDYYPAIINKLNLRAFYRMYKEPHTIKRYFIDYPKNLLIFLFLVITKKIKLEIVS